MSTRVDVTGITINKIKFINYSHTTKNKKAAWNCKCFCGKIFKTYYSSVKNNHTKSCGCLRHLGKKRKWKSSNKHLYSAWIHMIHRCYKKDNDQYHRYGGRGIKVFHKWTKDFNEYSAWINKNLGEKPSDSHSIDRIDNNKNYYPSNLRWASKAEQAQNTSRTKLTKSQVVDIRNSNLSKTKLAAKYNIDYSVIHRVINRKIWKNI